MGKGFLRDISPRRPQMVKHTKKSCSTSLTISKMLIKTTWSYSFAPFDSRNQRITARASRDVKNLNHWTVRLGVENSTAHVGKVPQLLQNVRHSYYMADNFAPESMYTYREVEDTHPLPKLVRDVHHDVIQNRQANVISTVEWIRKMRQIHKMEYYLAIK